MRAAALWLLLVWLIGSSDHVRNAAHHPIGRRRLQTAVSRPGARVSVAPYVKKGGEPKLAAPM